STARKNEQSDRDEKCSGQRNLPPAERVVGMRIEYGEIDRPKNLPDIYDVADERVLESPQERQLTDRSRCVNLERQGNKRCGGGKREQRNFFSRHSPKRRCVSDAVQRPIIEQ